MDIISHGLWGALAAKAINNKLRSRGSRTRRLDVLLTGFWGVLPDLIAFLPISILFGGGILFGHLEPELLPRPHDYNGIPPGGQTIFGLTHALYNVTHSVVVFGIVFTAVWAFRRFVLKRRSRAPILEMSAWLLHMLIDLPTHSYQAFPTPILWPISSWRFDGLPWSTPWFVALNFTALAVAFYLVGRRHRALNDLEAAEEELQPALVPVRSDKIR